MNDSDDIIHRVFIKPDYDTRTFETRLLFLKEIFENTFDRSDIMGRSILYKLEQVNKAYEKELNSSSAILMTKNPVTVLTGIKNFNN